VGNSSLKFNQGYLARQARPRHVRAVV
jgi:hypothetical protein